VESFQISESDTDDFLDLVKCAIAENRIVRPYNELKDALVFSFDAEWNGFSNYSKGWHRDRRKRPYLTKSPTVIEKLEAMMARHRQSGGRIFIDNEYAYFVDRESKRTNVCELSWPTGRNVVDEILCYWNAQRRPTLTIANAFHLVNKAHG
jgi:hypothetical protein